MTDDVLLTILIVLPFVGSLLAATFRPNARNSEAWLAGGVALICLFLLVFAYPAIVERGVLRSEAEWIPALGLSFSLRLDGFAWMFALLVTGIGFLTTSAISGFLVAWGGMFAVLILALALPLSRKVASVPISSRMRALSSSVDLRVPVATTTMPNSCSADTTDQLLTPPVYSSTRLPVSRARRPYRPRE